MILCLRDKVLVTFVDVEKWKISLTVLAADGYFPQLGNTFYLVGEWFTTVIVMIYILFPFLRVCMNRFKILYLITLIVLDLMGVLGIWNPMGIVLDGNIFLAITIFSIGYCMADISINLKIIFALGLSGGLLFIIGARYFPSAIINALIGILIYIGLKGTPLEKCKNTILGKCTSLVAKYSYGIYLTHHFVIRRIVPIFTESKNGISVIKMCMCLGICAILTVVYTALVYGVENILKYMLQPSELG